MLNSLASRTASSRPWLFAYVFYTAYMAVLFIPLWAQITEPKWDANDFGYPGFTYLADSIREGRFPLWDPYTNCGYPYHADPNNPTLNPLAILLGLVLSKTSLGFVLFWLLHWWWGGAGMIKLARYFGASPLGALVSAAGYSLSGFFVGHAEATTFIIIASWLPWTFYFADRAVSRSEPAYALLAGVSMGMALMGGYPVLLCFSWFALALWLSLRFLSRNGLDDSDTRPLGRRLLWVGGVLVAVSLIMVAVWSPILHAFFVEGGGYTERVGALTPEKANFSEPFSTGACVSLFFPFASIIGEHMFGADISMTSGYMGMLTVPLAALWFIAGRGRRRPWWMLFFAVFMFLVSLGGQAYIRTLLYYVFPPMRFMRFSGPFRLYWIFPLCLVAGLGFTHLLKLPEDRRLALKALIAWALAAVPAGIWAAFFLSAGATVSPSDYFRLYLPGAVVLAAGVWVLWAWSGKRQGKLHGMAPVLLAGIILLDMGVHLYNNEFTVWKEQPAIYSVELDHKRTTLVFGGPEPRVPYRLAGYMNVQQVLKKPTVRGYMSMKDKGFNEVLINSAFLDVLASPGRFWLSPGVTRTPPRDIALDILARTPSWAPVPVFVDDPPPLLPDDRAAIGSFGYSNINSYSPERVEMDVDVPGAAGGFLASTERYAAGWKVWVDGVRQKVWVTNLYFRGVFVPPGRHTVVWRYEPDYWPALVVFSFSALILTLSLAAYLIVSSRR